MSQVGKNLSESGRGRLHDKELAVCYMVVTSQAMGLLQAIR
jgi:hypothetical protein